MKDEHTLSNNIARITQIQNILSYYYIIICSLIENLRIISIYNEMEKLSL